MLETASGWVTAVACFSTCSEWIMHTFVLIRAWKSFVMDVWIRLDQDVFGTVLEWNDVGRVMYAG